MGYRSKFYSRRQDAARQLKPGEYVEEYDLIKIAEWIKLGKDYRLRTEEAILLYE